MSLKRFMMVEFVSKKGWNNSTDRKWLNPPKERKRKKKKKQVGGSGHYCACSTGLMVLILVLNNIQTATCRQNQAHSSSSQLYLPDIPSSAALLLNSNGQQQQLEQKQQHKQYFLDSNLPAVGHQQQQMVSSKSGRESESEASQLVEPLTQARVNNRTSENNIARLALDMSQQKQQQQVQETIRQQEHQQLATANNKQLGSFYSAAAAAAGASLNDKTNTAVAADANNLQQLTTLAPSTVSTQTLSSSTTLATGANTNEDNMKFPLYMRILATLACLIIFTIGVCGNLLVPLVVIKTKYLRNSTNLFLINLSVADLLVLIVCMPTVLIELHSRPETWLLGEPMCKMSNFVEMLAANGSIFTILAISFERYYAICKPLKAGYKCTRLRATIIICLIWILSTLLTSPILIMAKSSETIYIDGSLVYNCILETDTYWHKMYVFVSMIAFFCLPLIVLMLVYWLIGRRLIRENLAMSTTTSLATTTNTDHFESQNSGNNCSCFSCQHHYPLANQHYHHCQLHSPLASNALHAVKRRVGGLKKGASFKSISASLFSLLQNQSYHQINQHQQQQQQTYKATCATNSPEVEVIDTGSRQIKSISTSGQEQREGEEALGSANGCMPPITQTQRKQKRANLMASKALSLDNHFTSQQRTLLTPANTNAANGTNLGTSQLHDEGIPVSFNSGEMNSYSSSSASSTEAAAAAVANQMTCDVTCGKSKLVLVNGSGANDLDQVEVKEKKKKTAEESGLEKEGKNGVPIKRSLANQFVYHLFRIRLMKPNANDNLLNNNNNKKDTSFAFRQHQKHQLPDNNTTTTNTANNNNNNNIMINGKSNGLCMMGKESCGNRLCTSNGNAIGGYLPPTGSELSKDDDDNQSGSHTPFIAMNSVQSGHSASAADDPISKGFKRGLGRSSRFYWAKRFSVSSSSASMQTNCTNLASENSTTDTTTTTTTTTLNNTTTTNSNSLVHQQQVCPRPIIHCNSSSNSGDEQQHQQHQHHTYLQKQRSLIGTQTKKCAHFSLDTTGDGNSSPSPPICSSTSDNHSSSSSSSSASNFSSKTPSPDPLFSDHSQAHHTGRGHQQHNGISSRSFYDTSGSKAAARNHYGVLTKNSSMVMEVDEEEATNENDDPHSMKVGEGKGKGKGELETFVSEISAENGVREISSSSSSKTSNQQNTIEENGVKSTLLEQEFSPSHSDSNCVYKRAKGKLPIRKGKSLEHRARDNHHHNFHFNLRRSNTKCGTQSTLCCHHNHNHYHPAHNGQHLSEVLVVQDQSKKQQMDSRRQVVVMLAFVVACFFLLFFPYRVFTIWLILSTEDQVQSLGMETYYNLTYFSRILIYLHSAINPIAYNLISTKFRRAFMSILLCRGSSTRRHFTTEHRFIATNNKSMVNNHNSIHFDHKKQQLKQIISN